MPEEAEDRTMTYGSQLSMKELKQFLLREIELNKMAFDAKGRRRAPCIWGPPGVGKTDIIKGFAELGYVIKNAPLAQFEEMGDLNGIPQERKDEKSGEWMTYMCPPQWAPNLARDGEKVILLLDDFNRADPRIIKGTMQLIQDYSMTAWDLNQRDWHIMCTANPEGGLNDVAPLDPAQISRFSHVTLKIEHEQGARDWAAWADAHGVDKRGITFMLMNPKALFNGKDRVNPRTWTQAFDILKLINTPAGAVLDKEQAKMMTYHIEACVDKDAASQFLAFMTKGILEMIEPEEILDNLDAVMPKLRKLSGLDGAKTPRNDCLFAIYERLYLYVRSDACEMVKNNKKSETRAINFCKLISGELAGQDMRWAMARRLYWGDGETARKKTVMMMEIAKSVDKEVAGRVTKMLADTVQ